MSKRTVLNATSRKKRNNMLLYTNTSDTGAGVTPAKAPLIVSGNRPYFGVWCASAQNLSGGGGLNTIVQEAARTSTTCYMRGLSEKLRIQTSTSLPWFHRRICFTTNDRSFVEFILSNGNQYNNYIDVTNEGMQREMSNLNLETDPTLITTAAFYRSQVFKGSEGVDWNDQITAATDNRRVSIKFDKTWTITSGNERGTVRSRKLWHPMNKNLVYDDDETGEAESTRYYSVESKQGMGNYMVLDIITPGAGATASDLFRVTAESTLYWHEK